MGRRWHHREGWLQSSTGGLPHWALLASSVAIIGIVATVALGTTHQASNAITPGATRYVETTPPPTTRDYVSAYLIGDSITAGERAGHRYGDRLAEVLNWDLVIDGIGATGFVAKGFDPQDGTEVEDRSFPTRSNAIIEAAPDIVLIAGGRNDVYSGRENVPQAIDSFYRALRAGLPDAQIVTISPWLWNTTTEQPYAEGVERVNALLQVASDSVGGIFVNSREAVTPFTDAEAATLLATDAYHPNEAGYERVGEELARSLVSLSLPRGPERWRETAFNSGDWFDAGDSALGRPTG